MGNIKRIALVVGASGGIGGAVARNLAAQGIIVYAGYNKNIDAASHLVDEITASGYVARSIAIDIRNLDSVINSCRSIFDENGRFDILVNCAAVNRESPALGMDDKTWNEALETNLTGAFRLCREAAQYMMLGRWGRIVVFSSISASHGGRGQINYAVSKAGVEVMTRVLALELGRKGILVNCIAPGIIETPLSKRIRDKHGAVLLDEISLRRFGNVNEIVDAVLFLVSDSASYINGQVIRVDGGMNL
jgi:3-oxoacyl-[acyl-carrier protein] reductase